MDKQISSRITALTESMERRRLEQEAPVDDLSRSLFEFRRELAGLDEAGRDALFQEWNEPDENGVCLNMTREAFDRFLADFAGV